VYVGRRSAIAGFTGKDPLRFTASATFMGLSRRKFLHAAAGAAAVPGVARVVSASDYPMRPVRLIIGYPPGGSAGMTARLTSQWPSERLGQQFIVESRPGAATNIATESVVRGSAGWLYAVARRASERDQRRPIRAAQFRFHARYHAGDWDYSFS
jgi:hypothetical protein